MKEYMRDYRIKQKQKEEEKRHCIFIRNQSCYHKEVEDLLLKAEEEIALVNEDIIGDSTKVSVTYNDLYKDIDAGTTILIDD